MQVVQMDDIRVKGFHPADEFLRGPAAAEPGVIQQPGAQGVAIDARLGADPMGVFFRGLRHRVPAIGDPDLVPHALQGICQVGADPPGAAPAAGVDE